MLPLGECALSGKMDGMTVDKRITWQSDVSPANWIAPRLHPFTADTGSVIPEDFGAYCRIFHPVEPQWPETRVRGWAEVAAENGRIAHPEMQFHMINRPLGAPAPLRFERGQGPDWGSLPPQERSHLIDVLRPETTTPEHCWFCIWDGFNAFDIETSARVRHPNRDYALFAGPIELALVSLDLPRETNSPNLWWPEDGAWIVATEIDFAWTYVGGSTRLIERIVSDDRLEALPAQLSDKPFYDSDVVNAALDEA
jgi:hypothetical protein